MRLITYNFDFRETEPKPSDWTYIGALIEQVPRYCHHITTTEEYQRYEFFNGPKYGQANLRYLVGLSDDDKVIGVLPLHFTARVEDYEYWEFIGALSYANYYPPCPPELFHLFLPEMPAMLDEFVSPWYWEATGLEMTKIAGGFFRLPYNGFTNYLNSVSGKNRNKFKANIARNNDLIVEFSNQIRQEAVDVLLPPYQAYWDQRRDEAAIDTAKKVAHDIEVFRRYPERAIIQYVYKPDMTPMAINLAWLEDERVVDMLCLRGSDPESLKRGLGIFCVLNNISYASNHMWYWYTLTPGAEAYKSQFFPEGTCQSRLQVGSIVDLLMGKRDIYYKGNWMKNDLHYANAVQALSQEEVTKVGNELEELFLPSYEQFVADPEHAFAKLKAEAALEEADDYEEAEKTDATI